MEIEATIQIEIEAIIQKMKYCYSALLNFIDASDDTENEYEKLINIFENQKILENKGEIILLFQLISKISDNHHRTTQFFEKLEKIFNYLIKDSSSYISTFFNDYKNYNKRLIFLLLETKLIKPDEPF